MACPLVAPYMKHMSLADIKRIGRSLGGHFWSVQDEGVTACALSWNDEGVKVFVVVDCSHPWHQGRHLDKLRRSSSEHMAINEVKEHHGRASALGFELWSPPWETPVTQKEAKRKLRSLVRDALQAMKA